MGSPWRDVPLSEFNSRVTVSVSSIRLIAIWMCHFLLEEPLVKALSDEKLSAVYVE